MTTNLSDIKHNGWTNYETWLTVSHILDDDPATTERFVDAACSTHYDGFVGDVQALAHNTWDGVPWFAEAQGRSIHWREIAESLRYV